ncbi:glutathione S-transferase family protein [uncultured Roseibium sp.]|uniref:glutathione S-transferase family protein n=1 Tax=uncultured Roseibium sp. TaxID=1936171 RepID=UPI0026106042|nr:glutathione S-transferase family protein [uncultured Roseibium sp.]
MPEIEPGDRSLKDLQGLHLWHAPMSSCSQRVRIVLAETGKDYTSHLIDLAKDEHATPEYQAIHPNGLVPAFVDNGRLFIESVDIIQQIADPGSELSASGSTELLAMADDAQADLKLATFEFLFRGVERSDKESFDTFQQQHRNEWLKQFRRDFASGFEKSRIDAVVTRTDKAFKRLDDLLTDGRRFLSGNTFGLADIAWMPNVHRFSLMGWPFERTPHLKNWFERVSERQSYKEALLDWQNEALTGAFADYTSQRRSEGTDIRTFGSLDG